MATARKSTKRTAKAKPLRLEWIDPATLKDNPSNWRRHPDEQTAALSAALDEVGWAGALLYNERTKRLIDGHARKKVAKKGEAVPVLVGSWTPEQERKILATLDPLAAMAEADDEALRKLLADVQTDNEDLAKMLAKLGHDTGAIVPDFQPVGEDEQGRLDQKAPIKCPECGHEWQA